MNILLEACGSALPKKILSNDDLANMVDTSDEWIFSRTGIKTRHILEKDESLNDLCIEASKKAIEKSLIKAENIDLIVVGTSTPDNNFPNTACTIQAAVGAKQAICFDVSAACSGFIYAMHLAKSLMKSENYKTALVIGADALSKVIDWQDRTTCILFGDGAGAAILKADKNEKSGILSSFIASDGSRKDSLTCPSRGEYPYISMKGQEVFKFAVRTVPEAIEKSILDAGIKKEDVKMYVLHQANIRILEAVAKKLGEPMEKFPSNLERLGNTSGGSVILLLDELLRENKLRKGDIIVISGFGAGLSYGAMTIII